MMVSSGREAAEFAGDVGKSPVIAGSIGYGSVAAGGDASRSALPG
jgi:hypothetical protein